MTTPGLAPATNPQLAQAVTAQALDPSLAEQLKQGLSAARGGRSGATLTPRTPAAVTGNSGGVNSMKIGFGDPTLNTPSYSDALQLFFGVGSYQMTAKAIGGASSDPWNAQSQLWEKQYNALDKRDLKAVEAWRANIAAVFSGQKRPDSSPLNADGKTPYTGTTQPSYADVSGFPTLQGAMTAQQAPIDAKLAVTKAAENYAHVLAAATAAIAASNAAEAKAGAGTKADRDNAATLAAVASQAAWKAEAAFAEASKAISDAQALGVPANELPALPSTPNQLNQAAQEASANGSPFFARYQPPAWSLVHRFG